MRTRGGGGGKGRRGRSDREMIGGSVMERYEIRGDRKGKEVKE